MSKKQANVVAATILLTLATAALAVQVPETDPLAELLKLIANWQALSPLAIASSVIVIVVQSVKKFFPDFQHTRAVVVVGGLVYGLLQALVSGMDFVSAIIFVLVTSGGAVALYELFKKPLNTAFGVKK